MYGIRCIRDNDCVCRYISHNWVPSLEKCPIQYLPMLTSKHILWHLNIHVYMTLCLVF